MRQQRCESVPICVCFAGAVFSTIKCHWLDMHNLFPEMHSICLPSELSDSMRIFFLVSRFLLGMRVMMISKCCNDKYKRTSPMFSLFIRPSPASSLLSHAHRWRMAVIYASFRFCIENFTGNLFQKNDCTILCVMLEFTH